MIRGKQILFFIYILLVGILNYATSLFANWMKIPFFLDTWATSLGVMIGGVWLGIVGGVLYNFVMAFTVWGSEAWIWSLASIWIALSTFIVIRKGWLDIRNPFKIIGCGLFIGATNAILTTFISIVAFGGLPTYAGSVPTYSALYVMFGSENLALFGEHLITEISDKTVIVFIASLINSWVPASMRLVK